MFSKISDHYHRTAVHLNKACLMTPEFIDRLFLTHSECRQCPSREQVTQFFDGLLGLLFPSHSARPVQNKADLEMGFAQIFALLEDMLKPYGTQGATKTVEAFKTELPTLYADLVEDAAAINAGDPAAQDQYEVIRSYPGFYAIAAYRVAHFLYQQGVRDIPRSITEHAHSAHGIDIHPGATIGRRFCIDHGTGVVIGETAHIGDDVKIYQGVTLGALSVSKEMALTKRHPTVEEGVVIYAGATILGGETVIGKHSIIGGNVWITKSVPPHSKVYYKPEQSPAETSE